MPRTTSFRHTLDGIFLTSATKTRLMTRGYERVRDYIESRSCGDPEVQDPCSPATEWSHRPSLGSQLSISRALQRIRDIG